MKTVWTVWSLPDEQCTRYSNLMSPQPKASKGKSKRKQQLININTFQGKKYKKPRVLILRLCM